LAWVVYQGTRQSRLKSLLKLFRATTMHLLKRKDSSD